MIYGKIPVVFLGLLASEKSGSTNSIIASYILDNLDDMKNIGIQQFAEECNVSSSSISRFCRDIGLDSFSELKMLLTQANLKKGPEASNGDFAERKRAYTGQTIDGIQQVSDSLSENLINELVRDIYDYKEVAAFGLMKAETAAVILQSDLLMYGKKIFTNISFKEQIDYLLEADENKLVILFSFTGSFFDYTSLKPFLKKARHPKIWMITGGNVCAPTFVHKCIRFSSKQTHFEHPSQLDFVATIIAQEYNHQLNR
ncbi:MurR/RpiR family transcriptional regulator [Streptococcus hillyeri]|uniref:MurR/RpiR family transcriptional regulator n=1 Tax=Streptococcus hillyeri TaxID=2282420 RepID=A0A3L9DZF0_9STRE|nr:MurR/RpiR family transcriptional regulator [Streptococcus hillyeri]RLY05247.1 MurR/RpiR family transcriptional regulator [Streptococcus hillyeri]